MCYMGYTPLGRRFPRVRPFRLSSGRRLRLAVLCGLLGRWLDSTSKLAIDCRGGGACGIRRISSGSWSSSTPCNRSSSRKGLLPEFSRQGSRQECKPPPPSCPAGSNTFYADAIADCLEFIKRTSMSLDEVAMARG